MRAIALTVMLAISVLALPATVAADEPASQTGGLVQATAVMSLDGTWVILDQTMTAPAFFTGGPWQWNAPYPVRFTITDLFVISDQFEVYDNGVLVATTPAMPDWDDLGYASPGVGGPFPPWTADPDVAFASGLFSSAVLYFNPGPHSITIRDIHIPPLTAGGAPFPDGTVAFKAEGLVQFLTGGGQIVDGDGKRKEQDVVSFAGNLGYTADGTLVGQYQFHFHNVLGDALDGAIFHSTDVVDLVFFQDAGDGPAPPPAEANVAYFIIDGRLKMKDGQFVDGYTIYAYVADRGEPGANDSINFALWNGAILIYSSTWDFPHLSSVFTTGLTVTEFLADGNLQIHAGLKQ